MLAGDGIGPEVVKEAVGVLSQVNDQFVFEHALVGGAAYDDGGHPLPANTLDLCRQSDAVLLGAVGGPKYDKIQPPELRPEVGALLPLRSELNLYANVRPAKTLNALKDASPLKGDRGVMDLVVMRELTGGIYFARPRERRDNGDTAVDTCIYRRHEVVRIAQRAFDIARQRRREVVSQMAEENTDVKVSHMLVDNCAMQLVRAPSQFDVILTENMFGDILSDEASMITGSLGLLPSASLSDPKDGKIFGLYEPVHGSAPDIAGQGKANPIATILSAAMMLRYSFNDDEAALKIEKAVDIALNDGLRTADIMSEGCKLVSTSEMGEAIVSRL